MGIGWEWADKEENKKLIRDNKEKVVSSLKKTEKVLEEHEGDGTKIIKGAKKKQDSLVDNWGGF
jgi:hypothetical protein